MKRMCDQIIAFKPDVVVTEKGLSDLATHFFTKSVMGQGAGNRWLHREAWFGFPGRI